MGLDDWLDANAKTVAMQTESLISIDSPPSSNPSSLVQQMSTTSAHKISVTLQYGNIKELYMMEKTDQPHVFESLRQRAISIVEKKQPPNISNYEVHLFRHDYNSPSVLNHVSSIAQLDNGCVIEIIVVDRNETPTRLHVVLPESYIKPTFCDYCGELLAGIIKQGVKCQSCGCNFHKKCWNAPRNNCAAAQTPVLEPQRKDSNGIGHGIPFPIQTPVTGLPHNLVEHSYKLFTLCKVCDHLLVGFIKQGLKCRDCGVNVHRRCAIELPANCTLADHAISRMSISEMSTNDDTAGSSTSSSSMPVNENIPLFRLPGQVTTRATSQPHVEGWMIHFLLSDPERRLKHYWVLANNAIHMYNEYNEGLGVNPNRVYKILPLAEIIAITQHSGPPVLSKHPPHCFEIRTTNNTVYCVGENLNYYSGEPVRKMPRSLSFRPASNTQLWFQALKESLQPPPTKSDPENAELALEFANLYQVLSEKTLGSGQFGTVYSAIQRLTGKEVAVKVISKERFAKKGTAAESMRAEVLILHKMSHPGIVRLEFMCETKDKIFVVMEKMNGDMLEMILSQATGRLDSRVTRFLLVQILSALKYLHDQGIAHCDLKPENVLLSDMSTNFPQTKICDFGYARFIPESQFRKTIVGTPAYLPPEVLQRRGYNKSLDMWSCGVIIYVTLSGTFPFNEGEEIADQIQNAAFMFPVDPWSDVEPLAIDLIQRLLKVNIEERLTIEQCLAHPWLKSEQLYRDLRSLEVRLNLPRYLTTEEDDERYAQLLQQQGLIPVQ